MADTLRSVVVGVTLVPVVLAQIVPGPPVGWLDAYKEAAAWTSLVIVLLGGRYGWYYWPSTVAALREQIEAERKRADTERARGDDLHRELVVAIREHVAFAARSARVTGDALQALDAAKERQA